MKTVSATEARKRLDAFIDAVAMSHAPMRISGTRHRAVLVSKKDWRAIQETLHFTSLPGMRESIVKGLQTPLEKCEEALTW